MAKNNEILIRLTEEKRITVELIKDLKERYL